MTGSVHDKPGAGMTGSEHIQPPAWRTAAMPRAVLITGAARRVGRVMAQALTADGWAVAVHHHTSVAEAEELVAAIRAQGGQAAAVAADLAREEDTATLIARATQALGRPLGALINNASTFEYDCVASASRQSWDTHLEANLRAPFVLTQAFAAALPPEAAGCVVNIIDQRVWAPSPHFITYTLSKAGLWALTQTLALALAPRIRVVAVGPGPTLPSSRQDPADFAAQAAAMPLGHGTNPQEIADAVRFLLAAPAVTGQMIALDGGQHLGWTFPPAGAPPPRE